MRKRWIFVVLIAVSVVVCILVIVFKRDREPEYGGRSLSELVLATVNSQPGDWLNVTDRAIFLIGTNALPYLLRWISYEQPPWKSKFYGAVNPILGWLHSSWQLRDKNELKAEGAKNALIALGPQADGAIGALTKLMMQANANRSGWRADEVLSKLEQPRLFPTTTVRIGMHQFVKLRTSSWALLPSLYVYPTNAAVKFLETRRALQPLLTHPDTEVRIAATNAFRELEPKALEQTTP
jgi:hypothetical protein